MTLQLAGRAFVQNPKQFVGLDAVGWQVFFVLEQTLRQQC